LTVARKPDLPGAADFFQTPGKAPTATEGAAEEKPEHASTRKNRAADDSVQQKKTPPSKSEQAEKRGEETLQPTLTPAMDSLSTEPPQTIEQPPTEKVTFYLPARMLQELEVCRVRLLTEYNLKVNRSQITQAALALTLNKPELIEDALLRLDELARELQEAQ
jgi:hypothetical protein